MGIFAETFSSNQESREDEQLKSIIEPEPQEQQQLELLEENGSDSVVTRLEGEDSEKKAPNAAELWGWEFPEKDGLYDPALEKDACGVGFIVSIEGTPSHKVNYNLIPYFP